MFSRLTFIFLLTAVFPLSAQKIFWSDITQEEVMQAIEISRRFMEHLKDRQSEALNGYFLIDSIYTGAPGYIHKDLFLKVLLKGTEDISFQQFKFSAFQFDDFLERYEGNEILKNIYPVFDNHSVLVKIEYQHNRYWKEVITVMRKPADHWSIVGFHGFQLPFESQSEQTGLNDNFRIEKIPEAGIQFPVPADFSKADKSDNQINFYLEEETKRDAVFQILVDISGAKVYYYTYKFVEFANQQYDLTALTVRYLPYGILFEYEVTDSFGVKNKGITVGMESDNHLVVIQFYAFFDIYKKRESEFNRVFTQIKRR
jgi:hypothetical protein